MLPRPQLALFRSPRSTFPLRAEVLFSRGVVAPQRWATLCCAAQPSAVCAQISPPFWVATEHRVEFPALYSRFHRSSAPCTAIYTHQPLSPNPPPLSPGPPRGHSVSGTWTHYLELLATEGFALGLVDRWQLPEKMAVNVHLASPCGFLPA